MLGEDQDDTGPAAMAPGFPSRPPAYGGAQAGQTPDFAAQIPADFQRYVNSNDPIQKLLFQRIGSLGHADLQALDRIPDAAVEVLKRVLPEIAFVLDQITKDADMGEEGLEDQAMHQSPTAPPQNAGPQAGAMRRPMSRLGQIG